MKKHLLALGAIALTGVLSLAACAPEEETPETQQWRVQYETNEGSSVAVQLKENGAKLEAPTTTKEGFEFVGWYKDAEFTQAWNFDTDTVTANTTLYAKWNAIVVASYSVTFDSGNKTFSTVTDLKEGDKVTKPAKDPTKTGYDFTGWFKDSNATQAWDFDKDTVSADTTIYAGFKIKTFTVSFSGATVTAQKIDYNGKVTKPADPTSADGEFAGWYTDSTFATKWDFENGKVTKDITLYAKFAHTYTVKFKVGDSYLTSAELKIKEGEALTFDKLPTNPEVEGTFLYWTLDGAQVSEATFKSQEEDSDEDIFFVTKDLEFVAAVQNFAGKTAYRFEIETNVALTGSSSSNNPWFIEYADNANTSGHVVAGGMGGYSGQENGFGTATLTVNSDRAVTAQVAIALSPGWGQSNMTVKDGTHYVLKVNDEVVHFSDYNIPRLEGQQWNKNWGTAWVEINLKQGKNTIVFSREDANKTLGFPNVDYIEIIAEAKIAAVAKTLHFELNGGTFGEQAALKNDQNVAVVLPTTPDASNNIYVFEGTLIFTQQPTSSAQVSFANTSIVDLSRMPTLTKDGFTFTGWYTDEACTTAVVSGTTAFTEGMVLYAGWVAES